MYLELFYHSKSCDKMEEAQKVTPMSKCGCGDEFIGRVLEFNGSESGVILHDTTTNEIRIRSQPAEPSECVFIHDLAPYVGKVVTLRYG